MDSLQNITESELEIMRIIWEQGGSVLLAPLMEELNRRGRSWKPNTVLTFLSRLVDKGALAVAKQGRLNCYSALVTEEEYVGALTQSFLGKVFGGSAKGLVATLLQQDRLTPRDMEELQAFWREGREKP